MDITTILTKRNRQERKVFGQRVCLVPFTITDKPCLFFSDDHNTLLFFCIVHVQKYKSSKTQNDKHTKIQKHAEMQQSEKGQNTKMGCAFFPIERGPGGGGKLEGRHRNSRQMQPDALDDGDGVDLNIVIRVKDGITDRIINRW